MAADELEVYQQMGGTYLRVLQHDVHWTIRLSEVRILPLCC